MPLDTYHSSVPSTEIIIGLIGPLGVDLETLMKELETAFKSVAYQVRRISLIDAVLEYPQWSKAPATPFQERYEKRMDAGNEFREKLKRKDALALLAIGAIYKYRKEYQNGFSQGDAESTDPDFIIPRCAYILRSLKTPQEVAMLREVYGPNFMAIGAHMPRELRRDSVKRKIADSLGDPDYSRHEGDAVSLLSRDEYETAGYGQNMRETFPLADIFVNVSSQATVAREVKRFVEILFGHPSHTPRRAEAAMFHAYGAKLRSSSPGRQVGAAIVNTDGDILSVGTNEVAKAHGGQYWSDGENEYDGRDHRRTIDSSSSMLSSILTDLLVRMQRRGWLNESKQNLSARELRECAKDERLLNKLEEAQLKKGDSPTLGDKALIEKLIEYMRPVHAEMAALTTCTRLGIPVNGCDMYVTTFPCHECARLIVASGIRRVYFIEPYPKSRVSEMYDDSIIVDKDGDTHHISFTAFVGVAPRRFVEFFDAPEPTKLRPHSEVCRRDDNGNWPLWDDIRQTRLPRQYDIPLAYMTREQTYLKTFAELVQATDLTT